MYVCVYVCIYVYVCLCVFMCIYILCMCVCMYVCMYRRMYVCSHLSSHVCMYVSMTSTNVIYISTDHIDISQDQPKHTLTVLVLSAHSSHHLMPPNVRISTMHRLSSLRFCQASIYLTKFLYTYKLLATKTCTFAKGVNF